MKLPYGLVDAVDMSKSLEGALSPERITELALHGRLPHYTLDGSAPMFKRSEVKDFVERHMLLRDPGEPFPQALPVVLVRDQYDWTALPKSIANMSEHLHCIPRWMTSGVYFLVHLGKVVYVGQSVGVQARIAQHAAEGAKEFTHAFFLPVPPSDLDAVEASFIRALRPPYNRGYPPRHDEDEREILSRFGFEASP